VKEFESIGLDMIGSVEDAPGTIIKDSQPCYSRRNPREAHPLTLLARISNRDKHRVVVPMAVIPHTIESDSEIKVDEGVGFLGIDYTDATLENGTVALTVRFDRPTRVNMDLGISTPITFDLIALGYSEGFAPYGEVLNAIAEETDAILRALRPFF
jgi:hypothetical protein